MCRSKGKDLFSTSHQEVMSIHFLGSWASVHVVVVPVDKPHNNKCPSSCFFVLAFISEQTSYGPEYPFGQFGSAVLAVSSPRILSTPSLLGRRECCRDRPDAVEQCSAVAKTVVCYQHLASYQYATQH